MAKKRLFAKRGVTASYTRKHLDDGYDLTRWFEESLDLLHVPSFDDCCDTEVTTFPVRANTAGDNTLEYFNGTAWAAFASDITAVNIVANDIALDDGTVSDLALKVGADTNNGIYGVSDTQLGFAVEGVLVGGFNTTGLFTDSITEQTTSSGVTVDGALVKDGGISANSMFAGFFPTTAAQSLSGAGAVNVTSYLTKFTSTGASQALTIASGTQIGQRKRVSHVVDGGSGVLTGTFVGGTTITFTTVGEFADLLWNGSSWAVLELGNTATPGTAPALA